MQHRPVVLMILDGWGLAETRHGNAPALAHTPNFDRLMASCPHAKLCTHGEAVGLPEGQMGNSEVGHTNIGAGRVVLMDLPRIDRAIDEGSFAQNPALEDFSGALKDSGGVAHLAGLASDGGVHAHLRHIAEAARQLIQRGIEVKLHLFTDGRDTAPRDAMRCLRDLEAAVDQPLPVATVIGRFYAMDRDRRWDRTEAAFAVMAEGRTADGAARADSWAEAVQNAWKRGESDEFVSPTVVDGYRGMSDGDGLFFLNFRADRARQILSALCDPDFDAFDVSARPDFAARLGMVSYSSGLDRHLGVAFPEEPLKNTLGAWVAAHGLTQLRLAETEKYPHVTFFLNGGSEEPYEGERRHMAPSPQVRTYDLAPQMSAGEVTEHLTAAIREGVDLIVVNYANPDMVGHTGSLLAAMKACEAVDDALGQVLEVLAETDGAMLVTADHGNCETMIDPVRHAPHTAHTLNPVPLILVGRGTEGACLQDGRLADLAPTVLALMGLEPPPEMTGRSLLEPPA
ncbi:MAG TPA: 2,3-bisphosphoglycerate-independent phosphoglycerate mutase [Thermohalobaculum sp.]|nr:2,3-bisphosphoglycerate-independent phosphoglycerate mutase [Thermohalobaculum sp.]